VNHCISRLLTASLAVLSLALAVGVASANRLSVDDQDFSIAINPVRFESGGLGRVECPVTLGGSFHSGSFTKAARSLVGVISQPTINLPACVGGTLTILVEALPWHVRYESFAGRLPTISSVGLSWIGIALTIRFSTFGVTCLGRTTEAEPLAVSLTLDERGVVTSVPISEASVIDLVDIGAGTLCDIGGARWTIAGSGAMEDRAGSSVTLSLI
jgi:hypothetical protein